MASKKTVNLLHDNFKLLLVALGVLSRQLRHHVQHEIVQNVALGGQSGKEVLGNIFKNKSQFKILVIYRIRLTSATFVLVRQTLRQGRYLELDADHVAKNEFRDSHQCLEPHTDILVFETETF